MRDIYTFLSKYDHADTTLFSLLSARLMQVLKKFEGSQNRPSHSLGTPRPKELDERQGITFQQGPKPVYKRQGIALQ
jgi:hypothetical protein